MNQQPDDHPTPPAPAVTAPPVPPAPVAVTPAPLTERDEAILVFERQWWKEPGSKEKAVRERFGLSATRYYQVVNALIDRDEAVRFDPMVVRRLRRARAGRIRQRTARILGVDSYS